MERRDFLKLHSVACVVGRRAVGSRPAPRSFNLRLAVLAVLIAAVAATRINDGLHDKLMTITNMGLRFPQSGLTLVSQITRQPGERRRRLGSSPSQSST
jgi:hypothetical protein